jgi:type II secretory pathway component PulF
MIRATDIADFYQQLALLIKSNLPLPDSLVQLAKQFPRREMARIIEELGDATAQGWSFSEVLKNRSDVFPPFHSQLLAAGETTGTLPVMLFTVARFARVQHFLISRLRDVLAYPLLTIHSACLITLFFSFRVVPAFALIFEDLTGDWGLPYLTQRVMSIGLFITNHAVFFGALYAAFVATSIALYLPGRRAHGIMMRIVSVLPGMGNLVRSLDMARLCTLWSGFIRGGMPVRDILAASSQLVESGRLRDALQRAAKSTAGGQRIATALQRESTVDGLIAMTLEHADESDLAEEFLHLGELYEHRVAGGARSVAQSWTIATFIVMITIVGMVVVAMFLPMITIMHSLS